MKLLRVFVLALALGVSHQAGAQSHLDAPSQVDGARIAKPSGELTLLLLVDKPLSGRDTLNAALQKLNLYYKARRRGILFALYPDANRALPVKLVIEHLPATTDADRAVLERIHRSAARYGFQPVLESKAHIAPPPRPREA